MDSDPPFHGRAPHHERERPDISVLATTVLSVLGDKGDQGCRQVRSSMVDALIDATLAPGQFDGKLVLDALAQGRLGAEEIVDIYIPEAARRMGAMWVADDLSFARVTIGFLPWKCPRPRLSAMVASRCLRCWPRPGPQERPAHGRGSRRFLSFRATTRTRWARMWPHRRCGAWVLECAFFSIRTQKLSCECCKKTALI